MPQKPNVSLEHKSQRDRITQRIKQLANSDVLVGIPAENNARKGEPIGNAALLFLFSRGSERNNQPPRPVLEPAIQQNKAIISAPLKEAAQAAMQGKPFAQLLDQAGQIAENSAKRFFTDPANNWAPNAESTIRAKGSDVAGIDLGEMRRAITHIVKTEGQS
jgi:hypothetical protein